MKYKILLVAFSAAFFTGCSTAYKAGQTPDDVYYSPAKEGDAREEAKQERKTDRYETYTSSDDDNYLRMKIQNRQRWTNLDDFDYWYKPNYSMYYSYSPSGYGAYNPYYYNSWNLGYNRPIWDTYNYGYGGYGGFGSYGSYYPSYGHGFYGNSGYYSPIYVVKNPVGTTNVSRPALGGYNNRNYNNSNNTNKSTLGQIVSRVFSPSNNSSYSSGNTNSNSYKTTNNTSTYEAPSRSYTPPASTTTSSSSGSGSSGSSGGTISRPVRAGGN